MPENYSFRLAANKWVINARWFYIAILVGSCLVLHWSDVMALNWVFLKPLWPLFVIALLANALMHVISRMIDLETAHRHVAWLSFLQILFEISLIAYLIFYFPSGWVFMPALFFIPIVESIVLFGHGGPIMVSILIGIILNILPILGASDIFQYFGLQSASSSVNTAGIFPWTLIFSLVYLVVGFTSAYISRQIANRELKLTQEKAGEEAQMKNLENFNKELAKDARELKAKDFELEMANHRLEKLEEAKSKFVSVTAHQLRTPLSAIKWTFEMVTSGQLGPVNAEQKEFLDKGFDSVQRMIRIINDLLHVDNMETEKIDYKFTTIELGALFDSVAFEFSNQAVSKKLKFEVKKPTKTLPPILGDEVKLRIVLENLLDNAIKYTPVGGQVTLTASDAKLNSARSEVEIIVSDSGIGILEADNSKIFSKFFRGQNAISIEPDGSGIGLFISRDIIARHGGSLWYESLAGGGSAFHITLPLTQEKRQ